MKRPQFMTLGIILGVVALVTAASVSAHRGGSEGHLVTPGELAGLIAGDEAVIIDVRTPIEYRYGHIPGSLNVPLGQVEGRVNEVRAAARDRMVVLYCRTGRRAEIAQRILAEAGVTEIHHLDGQMSGWAHAGLPVARGD